MRSFLFLLIALSFTYTCRAKSIMARNADPVLVVASTLWLEARNQNKQGIRAVATVIYNRAKGNPKRLKAVCLRKKQFSCWNAKRVHINTAESYTTWVFCVTLAHKMVTGNFKPIGPWTHYYNPRKARPFWGRMLQHVVCIGDHRFGTLG